MQVKIICGTYGHEEDGMIVAKDSNSAPFEMNDKRASELIAAGIAEAFSAKEPLNGALIHGRLGRAQFEEMNINELRKLAGSLGLPTSGKKEKLIESIVATEVYVDSEEDQEEGIEEGEESSTLIPEDLQGDDEI